MVDEWAKLTADEPNTHSMEEWNYSDRPEEHPSLLPRSLVNIKREIAENKWEEAQQWVGDRTSKKKYKMSKCQRQDDLVAGSTKRLVLRFYQLKTGHARTGEYLHWVKARLTAQC